MKRAQRPLATVIAVLAIAAWLWWEQRGRGSAPEAPPKTAPGGTREQRPPRPGGVIAPADPNTELVAAWRAGADGTWVSGRARVMKLLADDLQTPRHQRLLFRVHPDLVVKLSHNIDLAPRLPLKVGDEFEYHGRYEMGEHGALVHWTHHDPGGSHSGGWVKVGGKTYR
ncbi:MAG: DUF3465 domain-containing protein [Planctomycetota bacterium]